MGHEIVGIEYAQIACKQFFEEQNIKYNVSQVNDFKIFTVIFFVFESKE